MTEDMGLEYKDRKKMVEVLENLLDVQRKAYDKVKGQPVRHFNAPAIGQPVNFEGTNYGVNSPAYPQ